MPDTHARLGALKVHGARLRALARPLFFVGAFIFICAAMLYWPSLDHTNALSKTHLFIPRELGFQLRGAGVEVRPRPSYLFSPADQAGRIQFALLLPALWLMWKASRFLFELNSSRATLLFFTWPFAFVLLGPIANDDRPVFGMEPAEIASHPAQFEPRNMTSSAADQLHFVLAEKAYVDRRPDLIATHLRALTGAYRPDGPLVQMMFGVLDLYAKAHGEDTGSVATELAQGHPHAKLLQFLAAWCSRIGLIMIIVGLAVDVLGVRRTRAAKRLARKLDASAEVSATPLPVLTFGKRKGAAA